MLSLITHLYFTSVREQLPTVQVVFCVIHVEKNSNIKITNNNN